MDCVGSLEIFISSEPDSDCMLSFASVLVALTPSLPPLHSLPILVVG